MVDPLELERPVDIHPHDLADTNHPERVIFADVTRGADPVEQQLCLAAGGFENLSTAVIQLSTGFFQQQALFRGSEVDTTAVAFDSNGVEVSVGICGEQGKSEFAASGSSTMAGSGVTAEAGQEWQYLCLKIGSVAGSAGVNSVGGLCRQQADGQQQ